MTSGTFRTVDITEITVERETRQRQTLTGIDDLAESIHRIGLINPIVVTADHLLVAGERRYTACVALGWTAIPVQYVEDLSEYELQTIELEENVKRVNLTWQEEVSALDRFHKLKVENEEGWTQQATAEALGYSQQDVAKKLAVAAEMHNPVVAEAERLSAASNIVSRNAERKKTSTLEGVGKIFAAAADEATVEGEPLEKPSLAVPVLNADFHEWQATYTGPKFNLIHCDFPYGINVADSPRMDATIKDYYDDSPDVYWALLATLMHSMENVVAESAHLMFWHSMKFHAPTIDTLTRMGWKVNPFPLIWHKSDGAGIAPDPQRGPRQTYEACIFATRGDRKITQEGCVANSFAYPGKRDGDAIHMSEKPMMMLRHFMRMICDEYSTVLDPTCGSGNALKVAETLGASSVLGLEKSEEFYNITVGNWDKRDA